MNKMASYDPDHTEKAGPQHPDENDKSQSLPDLHLWLDVRFSYILQAGYNNGYIDFPVPGNLQPVYS